MDYADWLESEATQTTAHGGRLMTEAELAEEEDQVAAALLATDPVDMPRPCPVRALMQKFTSDLLYLSAKMKAMGKLQ